MRDRIVFAVCLGFALLLVFSCADLARDNPNDPGSDKYVPPSSSSSDIDVFSSSSEMSSSSDTAEPSSSSAQSSSSAPSSSSSETPSSSSLVQSSSSVSDKCGEAKMDPNKQFCYNEKVFNKCNGTIIYDPSSEICIDNSYSTKVKCGNIGYNPLTEFCQDSTKNAVKVLCNNKTYTSDQFCQNNTNVVKDRCNGSAYDSTRECCDYTTYSTETQFCYNNSRVGDFCGSNPQKSYDPYDYVCKTGKNGIYLRWGIYIDGNNYDAVLIGTQVWMTENYGELYDWAAAMDLPSECNGSSSSDEDSSSADCTISENHQGICPNGWHVPSNADWNKLMKFVNTNCGENGGCNGAGKLMAIEDHSWYATDNYGFAALAYGNWWSSTESESESSNEYAYRLYIYNDYFNYETFKKGDYSLSIRCVRNELP